MEDMESELILFCSLVTSGGTELHFLELLVKGFP